MVMCWSAPFVIMVSAESKPRSIHRTRGQHKSSAIPITEKRLEQYGRYKEANVGIQIKDLADEGKPSGTEVVVSTPYEAF